MNWMDDNDDDAILKAIKDLRDRMTRQYICMLVVIFLWQVVVTLIVTAK